MKCAEVCYEGNYWLARVLCGGEMVVDMSLIGILFGGYRYNTKGEGAYRYGVSL